MPLDTSIPLQSRFAPINYEIPQPINTLMGAMKIKQAGQENALNEQKMAEYERQRIEEQDFRNFLAKTENPSAPENRQNLLRYGKPGAAFSEAIGKQETTALTQKETQFRIQKARKDFIAATQRDTSQNPSDANITAYKEDMQANPLFTDAEKAQMAAGADRILAMPVSERKAFMASQGASPSELKPTTSVGPTGIVQTPAFGGPATVVSGTDAAFQMTPAQIAQGQRDEKRLGFEGQRVGLEGQRVGLERERVGLARTEAERKANTVEKPMTQAQKVKYNKDKVSDKDVVRGAFAVTSELEKLTDELVGNPDKKIAPAPGLSSITGFSALTNPLALPSGDARKALQKLETFKGKIMALGRQLASQEGKLGNMAVQEWKFVSDAVQKIDPAAGNLDVQMRDVVRQAREYTQRQQSKYDDTYADDLTAPATPSLSPIDQQALQWANSNPADPRSAAIKQRLGR